MLLPALAAAAGRRQGRSAASRLSAMAMCGERGANADAAAAAAASNAPNAAAAAIDEIRRRFSSSSSQSSPSPSDLLRRFADPQLQPPSIVRLPPALQEAHDFVSSSAVAGGPRRLGPLAASLAGRLASRSRSLGRGGASAAAWEEEEEEEEGEDEEEDEDDEHEGYDEFDRDGGDGDKHLPLSLEEGGSVLVLDLVAGGTARVSAEKGTPLGRADEEALGWRGGGGRRQKGKKNKKGLNSGEEDSSFPARPAPPAYPDDATAAAYALARAPASFAATLHALLALRAASPSFSSSSFSSSSGRRRPLRVLDFGAGTGAAFLAAAAAFGGRGIVEVVAVERSPAMADAGRRVEAHLKEAAADAEGTAGEEELESSEDDDGDGDESEEGEELLPPFCPPRRVRWVRSLEEAEDEHSSSFAAEGVTDHYWRAKREAAAAAAKKRKEEEEDGGASSLSSQNRFDLVLASFSLGESPDAASERLAVESLWDLVAPGGALVVVEPGTPAGSLAVRAARDRVLSLSLSREKEGGDDGDGLSKKPCHVAAPCLHDGACPLAASRERRTWCHFGQRLERSRAQRVAAASAAAASGRVGGGGGSGAAPAAAASAAASDGASSDLSRPAFSVSVSSHTDVRFSYVALVAAPRRPGRVLRRQQAGGAGEGGGEEPSCSPSSLEPSNEQTVLARVTRAPRPRSGHVLVGACFDPESFGGLPSSSPLSSSMSMSSPQLNLEGRKASPPSPSNSSFGASVVTVTSSSKPKGTYRAARGARWGGVVALPASAVAKAAALDARKTVKNKS